jgi:hypothetical protein
VKHTVVDEVTIVSDNLIRIGEGIHGSGQITDTHRSARKTQTMCRGCHDDFYNSAVPGGCWNFAGARVVNKVGYSSIYVVGGPDTKMVDTLSCWHGVRK